MAVFSGMFLLPLITFAASTPSSAGITNPLPNFTDIPTLISGILSDITKVGGVIAIFVFIYSGYKFVAAQGNTTKLEEARKIFISTCIGVAVLLGAQLIAAIIIGTVKNLQS